LKITEYKHIDLNYNNIWKKDYNIMLAGPRLWGSCYITLLLREQC
jgi:hypothetical protein